MIEWRCPDCDAAFTKPLEYFMDGACVCPSCEKTLNMDRLRRRIVDLRVNEATEVD